MPGGGARQKNTFMLLLLRCAVVLFAASSLMLPAVGGWAEELEIFELAPDYVFGRDRRPTLGYRKPQVFDPLRDRLYRSGYRNFAPTKIPNELRNVDALTRMKEMKRILACADAWFWPFSRTAHDHEPPGIDIELLQTIAAKHGWGVDIAWVNTGMRFGVGVTFGNSIDNGICDIFLGLNITRDDHHMPNHEMAFTAPYMSTGFVLVTQDPVKGIKTLEQAQAQGIKVGVPAYSPMSDYAEENGIPYTTFFQNYQVIDGLIRREVDAAMLWSGAISQAKLNNPQAEFEMVPGYQPPKEMRWNSAWGIKQSQVELKQFLDEAFAEMLKTGETRRIVERYGVPFLPPFEYEDD
jgi:ABC-type amino acid transport substrate-binding protein